MIFPVTKLEIHRKSEFTERIVNYSCPNHKFQMETEPIKYT